MYTFIVIYTHYKVLALYTQYSESGDIIHFITERQLIIYAIHDMSPRQMITAYCVLIPDWFSKQSISINSTFDLRFHA